MVGDARLLRWVEEDNGARGVASPPQLVWEKGCALGVDKKSGRERCAASWRLRRSAAAKKWMQWVWQRGNLRLGRLPAKDILPTATMRAKAPAASHKKMRQWTNSGSHFGGRRAAPVWGPSVCFKLKTGVKKRPLFSAVFCAPRQRPCGIGCISWRSRHHPGATKFLRLIQEETSVRVFYEPRQGLRRPRGEVPPKQA